MGARRSIAAIVGAFALPLTALGGCAHDVTPPDTDTIDLGYCAGNIDEFTSVGSLRDWVSFGDGVVVFDVIAEHESEPRPIIPGETTRETSRSVTVAVADHLYDFAGRAVVPDQFEVQTGGSWISGEGGVSPFQGEGPLLEPGHRYVGSFVDYARYDWGLQTSSSVFSIEDSTLEATGCDRRCRTTGFRPGDTCGWRTRMTGLSLAELEARLAVAPRHPLLTEADADLGALDRGRVVAERESEAADRFVAALEQQASAP